MLPQCIQLNSYGCQVYFASSEHKLFFSPHFGMTFAQSLLPFINFLHYDIDRPFTSCSV